MGEYGKDVDISGYLDDLCEDSVIIEKKKLARTKSAHKQLGGAAGAVDAFRADDAANKEKFHKAMEREANTNSVAHR